MSLFQRLSDCLTEIVPIFCLTNKTVFVQEESTKEQFIR